MKKKTGSTLTISAVAFIAALLVDLYLILVYPTLVEVIIPVSLIVIVDTYFMVDANLAKVDDIASISIDKTNELTKVEKGIYSVAKREETARNQSMSALLDLLLELKEENATLMHELSEQDKLLAKANIKKAQDNTANLLTSSEHIAELLAKIASENADSKAETVEILNDICKALEERNETTNGESGSSLKALKEVI